MKTKESSSHKQAEAVPAPARPESVENDQLQAAEHETILKDLTDTLKRVQADYENYKKRVDRDRGELLKYAGESILKKMLPLLDNLDRALSHCAKQDPLREGLRMVREHFIELLLSEGVTPIPAQGLLFDPFRHEALMTKAADQPKNTILEEVEKGYLLHDRVLRPSKVIVSKGPQEPEKASQSQDKQDKTTTITTEE
jgi:molecular chaperone GrpE